MPAIITCPSCQGQLSVPETLAGTSVKCPKCTSVFTAPRVVPAAFSPTPASPLPPQTAASGWAALQSTDTPDEPDLRRPRQWEEDRPTDLPGKARAVAAMVLMAGAVLVDFLGIGVSFVEYNLYARAARQAVPNQEEESVLLMVGAVGIIQFLVLIGTAIAFCMWMYKAHQNLRLLEVSGMRFTPAGAAACFYLPFINLWRPCQVAQEIYRASDPTQALDAPTQWRANSGSFSIGIWWTFWILNNIASQIAFRMDLKGNQAPSHMQFSAMPHAIQCDGDHGGRRPIDHRRHLCHLDD